MITIDQSDTPNSKSELTRKDCRQGFGSGQRESLEPKDIHLDSNQDQSNPQQPHHRLTCQASWLSRAWRMLTNPPQKNEG